MHPKVLSTHAWQVVKKLGNSGLLKGWTLAGGTGLALQLGHRYSEDLDLFQPDEFESNLVLSRLARFASVQVQDRARSTLHALIEGVRLSFLRCEPPLLFEGAPYRALAVADPRDIAVMKIVAIGGRGSRKDFVDLYFYLKSSGSLGSIMTLLKQRFTSIDYNEYHLLKSLVFFDDAEKEPMPNMIRPVPWEEVKTFIVDEVRLMCP